MNRLHKLKHSKKKEANHIETTGNKSKNKKDLVSLSSKISYLLSEPKKLKNDADADIRIEMVKKYKEDINRGTYKVKTKEIAEKILQKYRE